MKNLILFDVDGTLTEPRLKINNSMIDTLNKLRNLENVDIGIVGGSDLKKQKEQLGEENIKLFKWVFSENGLVAFENNIQFNCENIVKKLGEKSFTKLINICLFEISKTENPVKRGTFIEYRNGMINISPIGRSCSQLEREIFDKQDKQFNYKENLVNRIKKQWDLYLNESDQCETELSFSIGGQISIDIFPKGWDKTYCLQFVKDKYKKIYFFGDKTYKGGNDYEIFNSKLTEGYTVTKPEDTINFLNKIFMNKD